MAGDPRILILIVGGVLLLAIAIGGVVLSMIATHSGFFS